jgi:hypothetical protein
MAAPGQPLRNDYDQNSSCCASCCTCFGVVLSHRAYHRQHWVGIRGTRDYGYPWLGQLSFRKGTSARHNRWPNRWSNRPLGCSYVRTKSFRSRSMVNLARGDSSTRGRVWAFLEQIFTSTQRKTRYRNLRLFRTTTRSRLGALPAGYLSLGDRGFQRKRSRRHSSVRLPKNNLVHRACVLGTPYRCDHFDVVDCESLSSVGFPMTGGAYLISVVVANGSDFEICYNLRPTRMNYNSLPRGPKWIFLRDFSAGTKSRLRL